MNRLQALFDISDNILPTKFELLFSICQGGLNGGMIREVRLQPSFGGYRRSLEII